MNLFEQSLHDLNVSPLLSVQAARQQRDRFSQEVYPPFVLTEGALFSQFVDRRGASAMITGFLRSNNGEAGFNIKGSPLDVDPATLPHGRRVRMPFFGGDTRVLLGHSSNLVGALSGVRDLNGDCPVGVARVIVDGIGSRSALLFPEVSVVPMVVDKNADGAGSGVMWASRNPILSATVADDGKIAWVAGREDMITGQIRHGNRHSLSTGPDLIAWAPVTDEFKPVPESIERNLSTTVHLWVSSLETLLALAEDEATATAK